MRRGEIRWYTFRLPDKRRPVLILTRDEVIDRLNEVIVAPATRTIRGLSTEVILTAEDGMPSVCALNFDHVALAQRDRLVGQSSLLLFAATAVKVMLSDLHGAAPLARIVSLLVLGVTFYVGGLLYRRIGQPSPAGA